MPAVAGVSRDESPERCARGPAPPRPPSAPRSGGEADAMSFTSPRTARRVPPYRPPTLFSLDEDLGPRHDLPSQARPPSAPERPPVVGVPIRVEGNLLGLTVADDRNHPGLGTPHRRIFDFHA